MDTTGSHGMATVIQIALADDFGRGDANKLNNNTISVYLNTKRYLNKQSNTKMIKSCIFIILIQLRHLFWMSYPRYWSSQIKVWMIEINGSYPEMCLKEVIDQAPKVFACYNAVLSSVEQIILLNNDNLDTFTIPSTS